MRQTALPRFYGCHQAVGGAQIDACGEAVLVGRGGEAGLAICNSAIFLYALQVFGSCGIYWRLARIVAWFCRNCARTHWQAV